MSASRIGSTSSDKPSELPTLPKEQRTKTGKHEVNETPGQKNVTKSPSPSSHTSSSKTLIERARPTKVSEQDNDGYQSYLSQGKISATPETQSNSFNSHLVGPDSLSTEALYQHISAPDANKLGIALHSNLGELEDDDEEWPDKLSDSRQYSQTTVPKADQITITINKPEPRAYYADDHDFHLSDDSTHQYTETNSSTVISDETQDEFSESILFLQELENLNDKTATEENKTISTNNDNESGYDSEIRKATLSSTK